jgi:HlyD family secretion protein
MRKIPWMHSVVAIGLSGLIAGCTALGANGAGAPLKASGTISTDTIQVAPEIAGKIAEIKVDKGETVQAGDVLFRLDDQLLQAQYSQAKAAVQVAQSSLEAARGRLASAQVAYDQALLAARQQDKAGHATSWQASQPDKITLPVWYFSKSEQMVALEAQMTAANQALEVETGNLDRVLRDASNSDFVGAEKRLVEAQEAFAIAQATRDEARAARDNTQLVDAAQKNLDSAQSDLDSAQSSYDQMLTSDAASRVMEARARFAVANERLNNTQDALDLLKTGDQSLAVQAAKAAVDSANTGVTQAQAGLAQTEASMQMAKVQLDKTIVASPTSGLVLSRPLNPGEVASPGTTVVEIGSLDNLTLAVYIPENQYGNIRLGQKATVTVDSFPGKTYDGAVTFVSDQAEFTPRNVQTVESRSTTVYKIEITLLNPGHDLKPGMPADATF